MYYINRGPHILKVYKNNAFLKEILLTKCVSESDFVSKNSKNEWAQLYLIHFT